MFAISMIVLMVALMSLTLGIHATFFPIKPIKVNEGCYELYFEIDSRVKADATLYWLLDKYFQDAANGIIWTQLDKQGEDIPVARASFGMDSVNRAKYDKTMSQYLKEVESLKKPTKTKEEIKIEFARLKLRCF